MNTPRPAPSPISPATACARARGTRRPAAAPIPDRYRRAGRFPRPRHRRTFRRRYRGRLAPQDRDGRRRSRSCDRRSRRYRHRRQRLAEPLADPRRSVRHRYRAVHRRGRTRQARLKSPGRSKSFLLALALPKTGPVAAPDLGGANYNQGLSLLARPAELAANLQRETRIGCTTGPRSRQMRRVSRMRMVAPDFGEVTGGIGRAANPRPALGLPAPLWPEQDPRVG